MKASEIFKNYKKELTEKAIYIYERSDQFFDDWAGNFENAQDFNKFIEENFYSDPN